MDRPVDELREAQRRRDKEASAIAYELRAVEAALRAAVEGTDDAELDAVSPRVEKLQWRLASCGLAIAQREARRVAGSARGAAYDFDELLQIAHIGLLRAVRRFDPDRGPPFSICAVRCVRGRLARELRRRVCVVEDETLPPADFERMKEAARHFKGVQLTERQRAVLVRRYGLR